MRILVVEDDEPIAHAVVNQLRRSGHAVDHVRDGVQADQALMGQHFDLAVLDIGLPSMDGFEVLSRVRQRGNQMPVLVISARDAIEDRIRGLDGGADDYLFKPFEMRELEARIRAVSRRMLVHRGDEFRVGRLQLRSQERSVLLDGRPLELQRREYGLLECLILNRGRVLSKQQIQEKLCDWSAELSESAIELYVHRLRKKLEGSEIQIRTIRGFGYLLQMPDEGH